MSLIAFEAPLIEFVVGIYSAAEAALGPEVASFFTTALGIAFYAIILGTFYKTLSRQRLFILERKIGESIQELATHAIVLIAKYTLVFPLVTFIWFMFLSIFLVFLGSQDVATIMYIAIAVVAAIRITAYWDEDISGDLAKMLPLGLLAYFIGDPSFLTPDLLETKIFEVTQVLPLAIPFFIYIILLEWSLRVLLGAYNLVHQYKHLAPEQVSSRIPVRPSSKKYTKGGARVEKPAPAGKKDAPENPLFGKKKKSSSKEEESIEEMGLEE